MVGGFSQSEYLQRCNKERYKGVCRVSVPPGVTAVSEGAVSYALNPRVISKRSAEQSFSLGVQASFNENLTDSSERVVKGPNGVWNFEKDRLDYFVMKGRFLKDEQRKIYQKDVYVSYPNAAVIGIYNYCIQTLTILVNFYTTKRSSLVTLKKMLTIGTLLRAIIK